MDNIHTLEKAIGKKAICEFLPMQAGDVAATCADISLLRDDLGYHPATSIEEGISKFVEWYRVYYKCSH